MPGGYRHLTHRERCQIAALKEIGPAAGVPSGDSIGGGMSGGLPAARWLSGSVEGRGGPPRAAVPFPVRTHKGPEVGLELQDLRQEGLPRFDQWRQPLVRRGRREVRSIPQDGQPEGVLGGGGGIVNNRGNPRGHIGEFRVLGGRGKLQREPLDDDGQGAPGGKALLTG